MTPRGEALERLYAVCMRINRSFLVTKGPDVTYEEWQTWRTALAAVEPVAPEEEELNPWRTKYVLCNAGWKETNRQLADARAAIQAASDLLYDQCLGDTVPDHETWRALPAVRAALGPTP